MTTRRETVWHAALKLRVTARRTGRPVNRDMAWDAIAEVQHGDETAPAVSATQVLREARRELRRTEEFHLI